MRDRGAPAPSESEIDKRGNTLSSGDGSGEKSGKRPGETAAVGATVESSDSNSPQPRLAWLDVARGYGMFLVFYGHLVERFAGIALASAFLQFKLIYSFHMPLFFILAGLVARSQPRFVDTLKRGLLTRIVPALAFNLLLVPLWLSPSPLAATERGQDIVSTLSLLFVGRPIFNFMTWFLFCLFLVDLFHVLLRKVVRRDLSIFVSVLMLLLLGQWVTRNIGWVVRWTGIPPNFWMFHEAVMALAFHQLGYALRRARLLSWRPSRVMLFAICVICWAGVVMTFNLNLGPFRGHPRVVLMAISSHGHPLYFPLTALLGTGGLISLAMLTPSFFAARWIGQKSLLYLGLNGVFYVTNAWIASQLLPSMPGRGVVQILALTGLTLLCLLLTAPVALGLSRSLPQLFGNPEIAGPLLPALLRRPKRG